MMRVSLLLLFLTAASASAGSLAFDFDNDDDPSTLANTIQGNVGDLVEVYLVADDAPYDLLWGVQFGIEVTSGLEVVGAYPMPTGAMIRDGIDGIAIAYNQPYLTDQLPLFISRFVVRLLEATPQQITVTPSRGWGRSLDGFLWAVSTIDHWGGNDNIREIVDGQAIADQAPGTVFIMDALPSETLSWGRIKRLYR